jgi:hypothetical protein
MDPYQDHHWVTARGAAKARSNDGLWTEPGMAPFGFGGAFQAERPIAALRHAARRGARSPHTTWRESAPNIARTSRAAVDSRSLALWHGRILSATH